ncbi:MAG: hypothetical protein ACKOKB_02885, partial [Bacteroidota bacterium]
MFLSFVTFCLPTLRPIAIGQAQGGACNFSLNVSAGSLSTNGANRKIGRPGGVAMCDKTNQTVGVRGALFGYFLGK